MQNRKLWLLPLGLAYLYALFITIVLPGWTWSTYDEMHWLSLFVDHKASALSFIREDWIADGRVRPLIAVINFAKFSLFGLAPKLMRVERLLELALLLGLAGAWLAGCRKAHWLAVAAGLAFFVKSPPVLEQLRWMTTSEIFGCITLVAALLAWPRSKLAAYALLLLTVSIKESFALLLPLPALLDRRWRQALLTSLIGAGYMAFLYLGRRGYGAGYTLSSMAPSTVAEIVRGIAIDFAPLVALPVFLFRVRGRFDDLWRAVVLAVFGLVYGFLVFPKASAYNYIFAPSIVLFGLSLAIAASTVQMSRALIAYLAMLAIVLPLRLDWNWTRTYLSSKYRHELLEQVRATGKTKPIGHNCLMDARLYGLMLDGREEGPGCPNENDTIADCCKPETELLILSSECQQYDKRLEQARALKLAELFRNERFTLLECPRKN